MLRRFIPIITLATIAMLASACSTPATPTAMIPESTAEAGTQPAATPSEETTTQEPQSALATDYASFVSTLRGQGWPVEEVGPTEGSVFSGNGHIVRINPGAGGAEVQVFEYADHAALEAQAALISADGGQIGGPKGTAIVDWVDMPHFFKSGRILAVYVGRDSATLATLAGVMGEQFAGGTLEQWGPGSPTPIPPGDGSALPPAPPPAVGGPAYPGYAALLLALSKAGATAAAGAPNPAGMLSVQGLMMTVNGQQIEVFEYPDEASAAADGATIKDGGYTVNGQALSFADAPHWYRSGKLIVLYVGQDAGVMALLEGALGQPMAFGS